MEKKQSTRFKISQPFFLTFVPLSLDQGRLDVGHGRARLFAEGLDQLELV